MRLSIFAGILVTGLWYLAHVVVFAVLCSPRPGQSYLEATSTSNCQKGVTYSVFEGAFDIISDFYLLILPIPAILGLQMPTKRKFGVLAVFGTGLA